jgi:hypothetical protein
MDTLKPETTSEAPDPVCILAGLDILRAESTGFAGGLHGRFEPSDEVVLADETRFLLERYEDRHAAGSAQREIEAKLARGREPGVIW